MSLPIDTSPVQPPGPITIDSPCGVAVRRLPILLAGDDSRVIIRPFIMGGARVRSVFERVDSLDENEVQPLLDAVESVHHDRHPNLLNEFEDNFKSGAAMTGWTNSWSRTRRLLAGAYLTMEYSIESAALFNPSIVPHPDQRNVEEGALRFVMSLRATGEGHVSSIVFRTGTIHADQSVRMDNMPVKLHRSRIAPDRYYIKSLFLKKLAEMGVNGMVVERVMSTLPDPFTIGQIHDAALKEKTAPGGEPADEQVLHTLLWLAQSNRHITLAPDAFLSELVIFPMSEEEARGIEDLRLVRFVDDDGSATYFGTYTGYDGTNTIPMLISTRDFRRIDIHSLNGAAAANKGMALFPRRIGGRYAMCSRIDGENLFMMFSDSVHFWESAVKLFTPKNPWELMQIGNCGSPIETSAGWLLLTHGVGPMRSYSIGAMLLDLNDPLKILGHLAQPLISPIGEEREGYVPNVVYTCGALIHNGELYLPYALADTSTTMAVVRVDELVDKLLASPPGALRPPEPVVPAAPVPT